MLFLSPTWFFALIALVIPVIIHLWNIRPGKTLKVGSIALISEASKTNRRSLKLIDILLFIIRCAFLTVLAFLLAMPVWQRVKPSEKVKGWVLIPKTNLREAYHQFKPKIDSLTRSGYQFHYFDTSFVRGDLNKLLADSAVKDSSSSVNYWNLIRQLNGKVSSSLPVHVFTPNAFNHFRGVKPATSLNLVWHAYHQADSTAKWISNASLGPNDAIKVKIGNSSPAGVFYTTQFLSNEGDKAVSIEVKDGVPMARLKGSDTAVPADTTTLKIAIYTDKYSLDATYLKAALSAAVNFNGGKAIVKQYVGVNQIPAGQTWLFWLSDQPVSEQMVKSSRNILQYAQGKSVPVKSWIDAGNGLFHPEEKIELTKTIVAKGDGETIWSDGFGEPILQKKVQNSVNFYRFYTHFNPFWTDLTWNKNFPKMMLDLIVEKPYQLPQKFNKRVLTGREILPDKINGATAVSTISPTHQVDLSKYFWLLLMLLFAAERWLSHQTKTVSVNG